MIMKILKKGEEETKSMPHALVLYFTDILPHEILFNFLCISFNDFDKHL